MYSIFCLNASCCCSSMCCFNYTTWINILQSHVSFLVHILKKEHKISYDLGNIKSFNRKCPYLGVCHIHPSGIEPVFDLLSIVDLQQIIAPKLHLRQLLVVFKEVHWECYLTGGPGSWKSSRTFKFGHFFHVHRIYYGRKLHFLAHTSLNCVNWKKSCERTDFY